MLNWAMFRTTSLATARQVAREISQWNSTLNTTFLWHKYLQFQYKWKLIFQTKTLNVDSPWNRGWSELGNSLMFQVVLDIKWKCLCIYKYHERIRNIQKKAPFYRRALTPSTGLQIRSFTSLIRREGQTNVRAEIFFSRWSHRRRSNREL